MLSFPLTPSSSAAQSAATGLPQQPAAAIPMAPAGTLSGHRATTGLPTRANVPPTVSAPAASATASRRRATDALRDLRANPGQVLYENGLGVSSLTTTRFMFKSKTTSAMPKLSNTVRLDGQPAPTIPHALAAGNNSPAAVPGGTGPATPGAVAAALQSPAASSASIDSCFKDSTAADRASLKLTINNLKANAQLSHGEATSLVLALRRSVGSASDANEVLLGLGNVNPVADVLTPNAAVSPREQAAWQFAAEIAGMKGGVGLDLLSKVSRRTAPPAGGPAPLAFSPAERGAVRSYLRAAQEVARAAHASGAAAPGMDPASIYAHGNLGAAIQATPGSWPGRDQQPTPPTIPLTLAEKALLAVRDELDPAITTIHGCRFAVELVRGGMVTSDPLNPDGTKSEFQRAHSRANKTVTTHVRRATRPHEDPMTATAGALQRGVAHKAQSSFHAYEVVVSDAGLGAGVRVGNNGGIHEGRAMKDMAVVIQDAIGRSGGPGGQALPTATAPISHAALQTDIAAGGHTLRNIVRDAVLAKGQSEALFLTRLARGDQLAGTGLENAAAAILARIEPAPFPAGLEDTINAMLTAQNQPLTPELLLRWGADAGGPGDANAARTQRSSATPTAAGAVNWKLFCEGFGRAAESDVPAVATPSLRGMSNQQLSDVLCGLITPEELGANTALVDSATTHGTTKNASAIASGIFLHGAGTARADFGGGVSRAVGMESTVTTAASSLRMFKTSVTRVQGGGGGTVGQTLGHTDIASAALAGSADAGYAYDVIHQDGVVFNFPRHLSGGVGGDRDLAQRKARLVQLLLGAAPSDGVPFKVPPNPEDDSPIVRALQEFGSELSIGTFDMTQTEHRTTGSGSVAAGVTAGDFKLGLAPTGVAGQTKFTTSHYEERTGSLKVVKDTRADAFKATGFGSVGSLTGLIDAGKQPPEGGWPDGMSEVTWKAQLGAGNFTSGSVDFMHDGTARSTIRILADDKELGTSFATTTFMNNKGIVNALSPELDQFAADKAEKYFPDRTQRDRDHAVRTERKVIGEFLGQVREEKDMSAASQLYWEFKDNASSDLLAAAGELTASLGDTAVSKLAEGELDRAHTDPDNRSARFVININTRNVSQTKGPNGLLGATHVNERKFTEQRLKFT